MKSKKILKESIDNLGKSQVGLYVGDSKPDEAGPSIEDVFSRDRKSRTAFYVMLGLLPAIVIGVILLYALN